MRQASANIAHSLRREAHFLPRNAQDYLRLNSARRRYSHLYQSANSSTEPLVSVIVPTYNRAELLVECAVKSILAQSYTNWELLVVGDGCTDDTAERMAAISDPRVQFVNIPRYRYPSDKKTLWRMAGIAPFNHGLQMAKGLWIAPREDDEMLVPEHLELLLQPALRNDLELIYGFANVENSPGEWVYWGQPFHLPQRTWWDPWGFAKLSITLLRKYVIPAVPFDKQAWRVNMGGDYHFFTRAYRAGVRMDSIPDVVTSVPLRPNTTRRGANAEDREHPIPENA